MTHWRTRTTKNGTKVTLAVAGLLEWHLQASAVRAMRSLPEFNKRFTFAGDFNAAKRAPQQATIAKATGLTRGEHDVRVYLEGGILGLIEMKAANGRLGPEQRDRHALLHRLGFTRQAVVKATTEADAAAQVVAVVKGWLAANDNVEK